MTNSTKTPKPITIPKARPLGVCVKYIVMFLKGWLACIGVVIGMFGFGVLYVGAVFTFAIPLIPIWIGSVYFPDGIGATIYFTCCVVVWCSVAGFMVLTET